MECEKCKRKFSTKGGFSKHLKRCNYSEELFEKITKLYEEGVSRRNISQLLKVSKTLIEFSITKKFFKFRNLSEALKITHKLNPQIYKFSEKRKQKARITRLKYLKEHPFDNAWRRGNKSYIEEIFVKIINKNNLTKNYDVIREFYEHSYYLDFAFLNIKLNVEIDGSQHWRTKERIEHDKKRDNILSEAGWKIYRIPEFKLRHDFLNVEKEFLLYLNSFEKQPKITNFENEIIEYKKIIELREKAKQLKREEKKKERLHKIQQKIEQLKNVDLSKFGWIAKVCKLWNVSHTEVKRFINKNCKELIENAFRKNKSDMRTKFCSCGKEINMKDKFCSRHCAIIVNNKLRKCRSSLIFLRP